MSVKTAERQQWFDQHRGEVIGQAFLGDRARLHIADVRALAPHMLQLSILCVDARAQQADLSVTMINQQLAQAQAESEQQCRLWWQQKLTVEPGASLDEMLPKGIRRPRMCHRCQELYQS